MVLENVPRVRAPGPEAMLEEWIRPGRPVIFTDLFDGTPLRAVDTEAKGREALGDLVLSIQPNYLSFLETGARAAPRPMSLRAYLDHVAAEPRTRDLCVEFETPGELRALLPAPPVSTLAGPSDTVSATFLANAGNYNHLHFDDDQRHVLLYQVFGIKRFSVIPAGIHPELDAFLLFDENIRRALAEVPARDSNGRVYLHTFPQESDREAFLSYAGAADCILQPGETLFMPALAWHYVEYRDTSLSVTYRLGRPARSRVLAALFPQPTFVVQAVGAQLADEHRFESEHPSLAREIDRALEAHHPDLPSRAHAVYAVLERAFEGLYGTSAACVQAARALHHRALCL